MAPWKVGNRHMNVELAEERILLLTDRFSIEHAEGRAWANGRFA